MESGHHAGLEVGRWQTTPEMTPAWCHNAWARYSTPERTPDIQRLQAPLRGASKWWRNARKRNLDLHSTTSINTHFKQVYRPSVCIHLPCQGNQSKNTTGLFEEYTKSPEPFPPVYICGRSGALGIPTAVKVTPTSKSPLCWDVWIHRSTARHWSNN